MTISIIIWTALILTGISALIIAAIKTVSFVFKLAHKHQKTPKSRPSKKSSFFIEAGIVFFVFAFICLCLYMMRENVYIVLYALLGFLTIFVLFFCTKKQRQALKNMCVKLLVVLFLALTLCFLSSLNPFIHRQDYLISTDKNILPLKIVMFSDSHIGSALGISRFKKHIHTIAKERPDILVVAGDFVDENTTKKEMLEAVKILASVQTKYGTYFVSGNHDMTHLRYCQFSGHDLITLLNENGIHVLLDENAPINNMLYIIGRKDFSVEQGKRHTRQTMEELTENLDQNKYIIVADHQPIDFQNQEKSNVDLVLSGHTHGGMDNVDLTHGHQQRHNTHFIVTSGLSKYAPKPEYVVINISKK